MSKQSGVSREEYKASGGEVCTAEGNHFGRQRTEKKIRQL